MCNGRENSNRVPQKRAGPGPAQRRQRFRRMLTVSQTIVPKFATGIRPHIRPQIFQRTLTLHEIPGLRKSIDPLLYSFSSVPRTNSNKLDLRGVGLQRSGLLQDTKSFNNMLEVVVQLTKNSNQIIGVSTKKSYSTR